MNGCHKNVSTWTFKPLAWLISFLWKQLNMQCRQRNSNGSNDGAVHCLWTWSIVQFLKTKTPRLLSRLRSPLQVKTSVLLGMVERANPIIWTRDYLSINESIFTMEKVCVLRYKINFWQLPVCSTCFKGLKLLDILEQQVSAADFTFTFVN
jgi:hypothetical protein